MERIVQKSNNFEDAERWDILQNSQMSFEERFRVADELKKRVFGDKCGDVRETRKCLKKR